MLGKGHFEGEYRSKPVVNIRGASQPITRTQCIEKAHKERANREAKRVEIQSAIKIQCLVRGFLVRRRIFKSLRTDQLPRLRKQYEDKGQQVEPQQQQHKLALLQQICRLVVFSSDVGSVTWVCQALVRERATILPLLATSSASTWTHILSNICLFCIQYISQQSPTTSIASCLRFFETYCAATDANTDPAVLNKIYSYLLPRGYFSYVRRIINARVPPIIEECLRPPTPMAGEILQMVVNPLISVGKSKDHVLKRGMFLSLLKDIFSEKHTEQIELFILPCVSYCQHFNFGDLVVELEESHLQQLPPTPSLLLTVLHMGKEMNMREEAAYISLVTYLVNHTVKPKFRSPNNDFGDLEEDEDEDEIMEVEENEDEILVTRCVEQLNSEVFINKMMKIVKYDWDQVDTASHVASEQHSLSFGQPQTTPSAFGSVFGGPNTTSAVDTKKKLEAKALIMQNFRNLCKICHRLNLMYKSNGVVNNPLLLKLALDGRLVRKVWHLICTTVQPSLFGSPTPLITIIARGLRISTEERDEIAPLLTVFCSSFESLLVVIDDQDFFSTTDRKFRYMPFSLSEVVTISNSLRDLTLGLIDLGYPESRPSLNKQYLAVINSVRDAPHEKEENSDSELDRSVWEPLFSKVYGLVKQLYIRDTRHQFCSDQHWISPRISLPQDKAHQVYFRGPRLGSYIMFSGLRAMTRDDLEENGPPLSTKEAKLAKILQTVPFMISFSQRVLMFQNLILSDKQESQGDRVNFGQGPSINIVVRRDYIYEDAFDKLSPQNEPNMKLKMRVQLINAAGLDEAGIDGGGLFREFLSQLIKAAFDPNRGFFVITRDQQLYPNPSVYQLHENASDHYYFIGRMIGKALYENLLVELPLAGFFLSKLLVDRGQNLDVGVDYLDSLDPVVYKGLMYLKSYEGDVADLGLDFTVNVEEFGKTRVELLKPEGDKIAVTETNKLEYIHRVAGYKLNKQIKEQSLAFRNGIFDVISPDWLRMFSYRELATLISGAEHDINVADLRTHTNYSGGFDPNHPTILAFWKVVNSFTDEDKRLLLKFVTSCSRPPLLGFKDLDPLFCIQNAGSEPDRLPTASTCMNLLKLPDFKSEDVLKKKLSYAIQSGAGFELS